MDQLFDYVEELLVKEGTGTVWEDVKILLDPILVILHVLGSHFGRMLNLNCWQPTIAQTL